MAFLRFETLWQNYPIGPICIEPRTGKPMEGFIDPSALRVANALRRCGVSFTTLKKSLAARAADNRDFINWLRPGLFPGCPNPESYIDRDVLSRIRGRTGIVYLMVNWRAAPGNDAESRGDHFDLWDGSRMTSGSTPARVHMGIRWDGVWSDFRGASKALFWEIA